MQFQEKSKHFRSVSEALNLLLRCLCQERTFRINIFDLEKTYDTTWIYGILKDRHKNLKGHLPNLI
jgi:hypothetical protein